MYDITIIGAGLAGLQLARLAARRGASVLLVDARRSVTESVRTTGIFVRKTFEDFPSLDRFLGVPIRTMAVHSPAGKTLELTSAHDEFRVGRMKPLYDAMLRQSIAAGVEWRPATTYAGLQKHEGYCDVTFRDGTAVQTRFVAGGDGARSRVARDLGLDQNREWITGVERVYPSASSTATPRFDCWIDPRLSPGYLAWIVDDGEEIHVGVGGDRRRFDPSSALTIFETRLRNEGRLTATAVTEQRGGLIPVNGVLRRIANAHGLLIGDAAGAVSPLTAGGLDACMRLSAHAAAVLAGTFRGETSMQAYDGAAFRTRFVSRLLMRRAFDVATRFRPLIELGFTVAQTSAASRIARHVFFGRSSFPDAAGVVRPLPLPAARTAAVHRTTDIESHQRG